MATYVLKQLPDNLRQLLDGLGPSIAKASYVTFYDAEGYVLEINDSLIPEHTLTAILLMITGYGTRLSLGDPAVDTGTGYLPGDTTIKILKNRGVYSKGDFVYAYANYANRTLKIR
jgi:hypothetical protein